MEQLELKIIFFDSFREFSVLSLYKLLTRRMRNVDRLWNVRVI